MKSTKDSTSTWVHVPPVDSGEPSAAITADAVISFSNGLRKFVESNKNYHNNMAGTVVYRCIIDLDHLARLMNDKGQIANMTFRYLIKTKNTKDAKKVAAVIKKNRRSR